MVAGRVSRRKIMRTNRALHKLRQGRVVVCPLLVYGAPDLAEQASHIGFDAVFIDAQHGSWTEAALLNVLGRFLNTDCTPIVRVKTADPGTINFMLDMGALGVIVPMVQQAEQARLAVQGAYYTPRGLRSGGGARLGLVGGSGVVDYFAAANDETLLVVMVESLAAIEQIDAIARVPGVDVVLIGPGDLALDAQARGHDEAHVERLVERVAAAAAAAGIAAGYVCSTPEVAQRRIAQGYRFLCYGSDFGVVDAGLRRLQAESSGW
jgi:4-hydroxy-2-oxoheptanedioate aldolase